MEVIMNRIDFVPRFSLKHGAFMALLLGLSIVTSGLLSSCGGGGGSKPPATVATITVTPATPSIGVFGTQQFTAIAEDSSGNVISGVTFTWASSVTGVATISSSGLAAGVSAGTTQITAATGGVTSGNDTLTVTAPVVATITVAPTSPSIAANATQQFTATAKDSGGNTITGLTFTWASSATGVATISSSGLATGVSAGSTQITAAAGGITSANDTLTVTAPVTSVTGTAAVGSPIAGATITLKDSAGHSSTATTASDGSYTLSTTGFTPPFLILVQASSGNLYSVSANALNTTTINTDTFTDLMVRSWYGAQGITAATAFAAPASNPAPAPVSVQILASAVSNMAQLWLTKAGINTSTFNLISTPFTANGAGLDQVLDYTTVNSSTGVVTITDSAINTSNPTTQTSTITYNTTAGTMTVATSTTNSNGTSTSTNTTVVPTLTSQKTALNSILATLTGLFNTANTNGSALTAAELTPYLASDLLQDSLNQTQYAAAMATYYRGVTFPTAQIAAVNSINLTNGSADIIANLPSSSGSFVSNEFWFENVNGTWLIGGDKRIAWVGFQISNRVHQGCSVASCGGSGGSGVAIGGNVEAPDGVLTGVTITDPSGVTGWNGTSLSEWNIEDLEFQPTPTTTLDVYLRKFDDGWTDLGNNIIPAGTVFTLALTPASGPVVDYTWISNASTSESISITSPTSGSLADYTLGQPITVTWTLPTTFPIAYTYLGAETYTSWPQTSSTYQCEIGGTTIVPAGAGFPTSGTITVPSTCNGDPVVFMELEASVGGINGEIEEPTVNVQ
jgi:hypothetical protein